MRWPKSVASIGRPDSRCRNCTHAEAAVREHDPGHGRAVEHRRAELAERHLHRTVAGRADDVQVGPRQLRADRADHGDAHHGLLAGRDRDVARTAPGSTASSTTTGRGRRSRARGSCSGRTRARSPPPAGHRTPGRGRRRARASTSAACCAFSSAMVGAPGGPRLRRSRHAPRAAPQPPRAPAPASPGERGCRARRCGRSRTGRCRSGRSAAPAGKRLAPNPACSSSSREPTLRHEVGLVPRRPPGAGEVQADLTERQLVLLTGSCRGRRAS